MRQPGTCSRGPHLVGDIEDALLYLLIDFACCVDEGLGSTPDLIHLLSSLHTAPGIRKMCLHLTLPDKCCEGGANNHGSNMREKALTSSTLCAVLADVSRNTSPCSLANCSPSSVVTARRCCSNDHTIVQSPDESDQHIAWQ